MGRGLVIPTTSSVGVKQVYCPSAFHALPL